MYSVENGKTAKLGAYVVGADSKLEKLGGAYVVNAEQKLEKLWSSASPQFLITTPKGKILLSEDLANWEQISIGKSGSCKMVYGNGTYVIAFDPYTTANTTSDFIVATSKDGRTWTVRKIGTVVPLSVLQFNIFFCNGQFIATYNSYESGYKYHVYTSSDGETWTKKGNSSIALPTLTASKSQNVVYGYYSNQYCYVMLSGSTWAYSTDLLNWTKYSGSQAQTLNSLYTSKDGTIFAIIENSGSPKICKLNNGLTDVATNFYTGYICGSCYNDDADDVCVLVGENNSGSTTRVKHLFSTKNRSSITTIGPDFYGSVTLYMNGLVCGDGKYVTISTDSSNTSIVRCHYSLGSAWTEVELGTVSDTGVGYNSSGLVFAKGE